jgi:hypothetical protein
MSMQKFEKDIESIKKLLAILLLKEGIGVREVAKTSGMSSSTLNGLYKKGKKLNKI